MRAKKPKEYFSARTARMAKRIGDSILVLGTSMSTIALETMPTWVTHLSIILTLVGKLVSNFFTDEQPPYQPDNTNVA